MRRSPLALTAALAALPLLAGCAALSQLAEGAFERPRLTFRAAALEALDLEGATIGFTYDLENPNPVGLSLARIGYGVEVEGTRIATGDLPGGLRIPASGRAPVTFPVRIRFRDVPGIVNLLGSGRDRIAYRLSGKLGVSTPIGVVDLPLAHEGGLDLPKLPRFELQAVRLRTVSLSEVAADVEVRVANPNAFAVPSGRLDWSLALGGTSVASGDARPLGAIAAGKSQVVALPFRVNLFSAGRAVGELARGGAADVRLSGTADLGGIPIPIDLGAKLPTRK